MITETQYLKLKELSDRGSMQSLKHILNIFELDDFQTFSLASASILEKAVISLDTGLGKTLIAGGLINLDMNNGRWLFISRENNLLQTAQKLRSILTGDRQVLVTNGSENNIKALMESFSYNSVCVISYTALNNLDFVNFIFDKRKTFSGIIVDESHNIGNKGSNRSEVIKHMMKYQFRYQYFLTATPLSINPFQVLNQINMIDRDIVPDPEALAVQHTTYVNGKPVGYKNLEELYDRISLRYISFTRKELGMKGNYKLKLWLMPMVDKGTPPKTPLELKEAKSDDDNLCLKKVIELVKKYSVDGKTGLIYANLSVYKELIYNALKEYCTVGILDGSVSTIDKRKIQEMYNSGYYSVLISNIHEGQDLPCDYIIFYELTVKYKQFIGRGERGLQGNSLDIHFVLLDKSYEVDYFYNNVYKRSLLLETLCEKDVSEIKEIESQLRNSISEDLVLDMDVLQELYEGD